MTRRYRFSTGLEKLLKSRGFAGQFVACQVWRDCFVKLGGAANGLAVSNGSTVCGSCFCRWRSCHS